MATLRRRDASHLGDTDGGVSDTRPRSRSHVSPEAGGVTTRYDVLIAGLRDAARPSRAAPREFDAYLENVRLHAYRVTDRDVEELKAAGFSEDEIFEHTVSAAVAAGLERLDAGLGTLR